MPAMARPWLISSARELEDDAACAKTWRDKWRASFPGASSTFAEKLAWGAKVDSEEELEVGFGSSRPHKPDDHLADILLECCPAEVCLQIVIDRSSIEELSEILQASAAKFFASAEHRRGYQEDSSEPTKYLEWLGASPAGTALLEGDLPSGGSRAPPASAPAREPDYVLLASRVVRKDADFAKEAQDVVEKLGLQGAALRLPSVPRLAYLGSLTHIHDRVGEMPHFPCSGKQAMAVEICLLGRCRGDDCPNAFLEALEAKKRQCGKSFLLVSKSLEESDSEDEDAEPDAPSSDNQHVLWVPSQHQEARERMRLHCLHGEGESEQVKKRLFIGSTDSGNLKMAIFQAEFEAVKELPGLPSKLSSLLALTQTMFDDMYWMHDNEDWDVLEQLLSAIAAFWRKKILCNKNSNADLGIGATDHAADAAGSREALEHLLKIFEKRASELPDRSVKFRCVPGPPRRGRPAAGDFRNPSAPASGWAGWAVPPASKRAKRAGA